MKIISWNVNGILSKVKKGEFAPIEARDPDVVCIQEVRTKAEPEVLAGYHHIWNHAKRDGFWGTLTLAKEEPTQTILGVDAGELDAEGRVIACEFDYYWVVNVYVPNSKGGLARAAVRREWDDAFLDFACDLALDKPVVICGDFNVALTDEDIYEGNPHRGEDRAFASDERGDLAMLLDSGYLDAFRLLHPDAKNAYTWWSMRRNRRAVDHGWRLDYFLVSEEARRAIKGCEHLSDIPGSDHCPIELVMVP